MAKAKARRKPRRTTAIARRSTSKKFPARKGPSPAMKAKLAKLENANKALRKRASKLKKDVVEQKPAVALTNSAMLLAGSAACGALKAVTGRDYVAGVAIEVPVAIVAAGLGYYFKQPLAIYAAAGTLAPLVGQLTDQALTGVMNGQGVDFSALLQQSEPGVSQPAPVAAVG